MAPITALLLASILAVAPPGPAEESMDRQALQRPGDTAGEEVVRSVEALPLVLLDADGMTPEEEGRRAAAAHARLLARCPAVPTPDAAQPRFRPLGPRVAAPPETRSVPLPPDRPRPARRRRLHQRRRFRHHHAAVAVRAARRHGRRRGGAGFRPGQRPRPRYPRPLPPRLGVAGRGRDGESAYAAPLPVPPRSALRAARRRAGSVLLHAGRAVRGRPLRALDLCRNAGFDLEAKAPDALRTPLAAGRHRGRSTATSNAKRSYAPQADGFVLDRLKRVLQERDGLFDDDAKYGLFVFDRRSRRLARCGPRQAGPGERPVILIHGLRGNEYALAGKPT